MLRDGPLQSLIRDTPPFSRTAGVLEAVVVPAEAHREVLRERAARLMRNRS